MVIACSSSLRNNDGQTLRMEHLAAATESGQVMVNDLPNQWLQRFTKTISSTRRTKAACAGTGGSTRRRNTRR
jgi:hypothetical protein